MVLFHFILLSIPMLFSQGLRGEQRKSQKFMKYLRLLLLHQYFVPLRIKQKGMVLNAVWFLQPNPREIRHNPSG